MCLIVHKPEGVEAHLNVLERGHGSNRDGFGIMYPKGDGSLQIIKGVYELKTIKRVYQFAKDRNMAMHFRMATCGAIDVKNCHPFKLLDKATHGRDLAMMHNGILRCDTDTFEDRSDTYHFAYKYLAPLLQAQPNLIDKEEFREFLSDLIGSWNKLVFMDGDGLTYIINPKAGQYANGAWYSSGGGWATAGHSYSHHYMDEDDDENLSMYGG